MRSITFQVSLRDPRGSEATRSKTYWVSTTLQVAENTLGVSSTQIAENTLGIHIPDNRKHFGCIHNPDNQKHFGYPQPRSLKTLWVSTTQITENTLGIYNPDNQKHFGYPQRRSPKTPCWAVGCVFLGKVVYIGVYILTLLRMYRGWPKKSYH